MRHGSPNIGVSNGLSGALEADLADRLVKTPSDELVVEGFFFVHRQQIGVVLGAPQHAAYGQLVGNLGGHCCGYGNQTIFFKLGLFNIQRFVVVTEVMPLEPQRFVNTHPAACQK